MAEQITRKQKGKEESIHVDTESCVFAAGGIP